MTWEAKMDDGMAALKERRYAAAEAAFSAAVEVAEGFGRLDPRLEISLNALATAHLKGRAEVSEALLDVGLAQCASDSFPAQAPAVVTLQRVLKYRS